MRRSRHFFTFRRLLVAAFVLALVLRIGLALATEEKLRWPDSKWYFETAESISSGRGVGGATTRAPLYPFFLATLFVVSSRILFVRVCESVLASVVAVLLGILGKRLFSERAGLLAAFAAAVYPYFIYLPSVQVSDNIVILLLLISVLCLLWNTESLPLGLAVVSGVFLGLCLLARPAIVTAVPGIVAWPFVWKSRRRTRFVLGRTALVVVVAALTVAPWTARNYLVTGHVVFVATGGGRQFWYGNSPVATASTTENPEFPPELRAKLYALPDEPSREKLFYQEGWRFVRENPGAALGLYVKKLANLFQLAPTVYTTTVLSEQRSVQVVMALISAALFTLGLAGAVLVLASRGPATLLPCLATSYCMGTAVFLTVMRYRLPMDPYLILLACSSLARILRWPLDSRR